MKPVSLRINAWGPYKGKEIIDFEHLIEQGVFLITGPTGAGKTTIFDAITFALYGEVSGSIREKDSVRSDFAEEEESTYVNFTFTHRNVRYEIERNPKYSRPKKRGSGYVSVKENAVLKSGEEVLVEGNREVTAKVEEILALNYKQFKQISMIAQGEFQKLLTSVGNERTRIFRNLFHTELCEKLQNVLGERSRKLYGQVKEKQANISEIIVSVMCEEEEWKELTDTENPNMEKIAGFMESYLGELKDKYEKEKKEYEKEAARVKKCIKEKEEAKLYTDLKVKLEEAEEKLRELSLNEEKYVEWKKELLVIERAEKIMVKEEGYRRDKHILAYARKEKEELELKLEKANKEYTESEKSYEEAQKAKEVISELEEELRKLLEKQKSFKELAEAKKELAKEQKEFLEKQSLKIKAKETYEKAEEMYKLAAAGLLAKDLEEGMLCPVCGSKHHPEKAKLSGEIPEKSYIEKLKQKYEAALKAENETHAKTASALSKMEIIQENMENIKLDIPEEKLSDLYAEKKKEKGRLLETIQKAEKQYDKAKLDYNNLKGLTLAKEKDIDTYQVSLERSFKEYQKLWKDNGFLTEEEFLAVKEKCSQKETYRRFVKEQEDNKLLYTERKENCQKQLKGKKALDLEKVVLALEEAECREKEGRKTLSSLQLQYENNKRAARLLKERQKELELASGEYGVVSRMENITKGRNGRNLVFEQYVLASYFDEILRAANKRLSLMSAGRYMLKRVNRAEDARSRDSLLMEVFDAYTGKARSVQSLSGGESFKASLSLALGMSDMIQSFSGGIVVETMFVDEGFGSLDAESLEQAVEVLTGLAKNNYTIGIISHVNELKEKIDRQLIVEKSNVGSRVKMRI